MRLYHLGKMAEGSPYHILSKGGWALCSVLITPVHDRNGGRVYWGAVEDTTCSRCRRYVRIGGGWEPAEEPRER